MKCEKCSIIFNPEEYKSHTPLRKLMDSQRTCASCSYWEGFQEKEVKYPHVKVITNKFEACILYTKPFSLSIGTYESITLQSLLHFWMIKDGDSVSLCTSYDHTFAGIVPNHLREEFEVNAVELTPPLYIDLYSRKEVTTANFYLYKNILSNKR